MNRIPPADGSEAPGRTAQPAGRTSKVISEARKKVQFMFFRVLWQAFSALLIQLTKKPPTSKVDGFEKANGETTA
jgi:hypothetical protein